MKTAQQIHKRLQEKTDEMLRKIGCLLEQKIHCQFKFLDSLGFILIDTMQLPDLEMIKNLLLKKKITFFQGYTLKI